MATQYDMKQGATVRARDLAGSSIIQQMGLDTPDGMQRLIMILVAKMDPENKGVVIDLPALESIIPRIMEHPHLLLRGENDKLFIKLATLQESQVACEYEESRHSNTSQ